MMDRFYKMMKRDNKGFTLVELMVVLLILGILVAIAIPIYTGTQKNAKDRACDANVRTIEGAVAQCAAENGIEPKDVTKENLEGDYLKEWPACPFNEGETVHEYAISTTDGSVTHTH